MFILTITKTKDQLYSYSNKFKFSFFLYKIVIQKKNQYTESQCDDKSEANSPRSHKFKHNSHEDLYFGCKKVLNIISLFVLILATMIPLVYCVINNKLKQIYDNFHTNSAHFQISMEFFLAIWIIIISK